MMNSDEIKQIVRTAVNEAFEQKKKDDRFYLMNLLSAYEANAHTTTFYNPAISTFGMSISALRGTLQIYMAAPIDKSVRGFAKPGEKRYDHDNSFVFGLTLHECSVIRDNFKALVDGTWERPQDPRKPAVDEKYKHVMEFQHQTRKFSISSTKDITNANTLRISIYDPQRQGSLGYILRPNNGELDIFKSFINNAITLLPFMLSLTGGVVKAMKSAIFTVNNTSNNTSNNKFYSEPNNNSNEKTQLNMWSETTGSAPINNEVPPWEEPEQNTHTQKIESFLVNQNSEETEQTVEPENVDWNF